MDKFNIIKKIINRGRSLILLMSVTSAALLVTTSCEDFLDVDSNMVIDAGENHLSTARDSIYSVIGILNKMQAIADRTVLLGEARGDLVDITNNTSKDLRDLALFNVGDDNKYNSPREYYAIINNCNYFIANVDTAMTNNRNENVFLNEYAVVKAIRAWTYLQLVTIYGKVPFVTEPILSKEGGEKTYPMYDIRQICDYFLNEDGLQNLADNDNVTYPSYGNIKSTPSRLFYVQLNLILGDLYLWRGSLLHSKDDYLNAAKRYYSYIRNRNGKTVSSAYPMSGYGSWWDNYSLWNGKEVYTSWLNMFVDESGAPNCETVTIIPMDSVRSEGNYSELRGIFCSEYRSGDNLEVELVPSESMKELSAAQEYCYYDTKAEKFFYAPKNLPDYLDGDLRLACIWGQNENSVNGKGEHFTYQAMGKSYTKNGNIHIYRRAQVYLRFAEAMNRAGFPRYAYHILASGVNNAVIENCIVPFLDETDQNTVLEEFGFPTSTYIVASWRSGIPGIEYNDRISNYNHIGIHSRGSGESAFNDYYKMPYGEAVIDTVEVLDDNGDVIDYALNVHKDSETEGLVERQILAVEDMIIDEMALETAFEGYRFYDLMRVAYRRDPSYLAQKIYARNGSMGTTTISADLNNTNNWFLKWNGKIGIY